MIQGKKAFPKERKGFENALKIEYPDEEDDVQNAAENKDQSADDQDLGTLFFDIVLGRSVARSPCRFADTSVRHLITPSLVFPFRCLDYRRIKNYIPCIDVTIN